MEFVPHNYQKAAFRWIINKPRCALLLDMGLGKTVTTLTALDYLIYMDLEINNALVIAPKRVVTDTWAKECKKWDHLSKLRVVPIVGKPEKREEALKKDADVYLISRDNIKWLVEYLGKRWKFDALIIDELSSFKSPGTNRFKALRKVAHRCSRVVGLTGTPAPNGYTDLWSQLYLIDGGERLGHTLKDFRRTYCNAYHKDKITIYSVNRAHQREIDDKIKDICISMTAKDYLTLPPAMYITKTVTLCDKAKKVYKEMLENAVLELEDKDIIGVTAAAVLNKLLQISNGAIYDDDGNVLEIHADKLEALEQIVEESQGEPILLFYSFKFDAERIKKRFDYARDLSTSKDIDDWNAGKIKLLLAHPASCGHGLNLQAGGHIIVWFGPTWSLELYQQANARLNRQGQTKPVMIYHLIAEGTADERVMKALDEKSTTQSALIECVKAELEGSKNNE